MYICVCNAVNDRQVKQALCEGKHSIGEVRRHLGFKKCCGRCTEHMRDMVCQYKQQLCEEGQTTAAGEPFIRLEELQYAR